jgi:tRNA nucleotidyltransferase (CCA-adding enzyme)
MVLEEAVGLTKDPVTRFAALVHDLGKAVSPMGSWPKHHGHEERGVPIIEALCSRLRIPNEYRLLAVMTSRYHLMIHRLSELRADTVVKIFDSVDAFRRPQLFSDLLIACEADSSGRGKKVVYTQAPRWQALLCECAKVEVKKVIDEGYQGNAIKHELHKRRVACVDLIKNSWK